MVEISRKSWKHVNTHPQAITFDLTIRFPVSLVFWKLDIQSFPGTTRSAQFEYKKTFKYAYEVGLEKARTVDVSRGRGCWKLMGQNSTLNASRALILPCKRRFWAVLEHFSGQIVSLFSLICLPNTSKHLWFFSFLHNYMVVFLHLIFLSLVPYLGFEV